MNAEALLFDTLSKPLGHAEKSSILLESVMRVQDGVNQIIQTAEEERGNLDYLNRDSLIRRAETIAARIQVLATHLQSNPLLIKSVGATLDIGENLRVIESIESPILESIEVRELYITHLRIREMLSEDDTF